MRRSGNKQSMALYMLSAVAASAAAASAVTLESTRSTTLSREASSVSLLRRESADPDVSTDVPAPAPKVEGVAESKEAGNSTPAQGADAPAPGAEPKSSAWTGTDAEAETAAPKAKTEVKEVLVPAPVEKGSPCSADADKTAPVPPFHWSRVPAPSPNPTAATPAPPPPTKEPTGAPVRNYFILGFPVSPGGALCTQFAADPNVEKSILKVLKKINNVTEGPLEAHVKCFSLPPSQDAKPGAPVQMLANVTYATDGDEPNRLWILSNSQLKFLLEQELKQLPPVELLPGHKGAYTVSVIGIGPPPDDIKKSNPKMVSKIKESAEAAGLKPNITEKAVSPCPAECRWPGCISGNSDNGGQQLGGAEANVCIARCSAITFPCISDRYCGSGAEYEGGNSVDCTPCSKLTASSAAADASASSNTSSSSSNSSNSSEVAQGSTTADVATTAAPSTE